MNSLPLVRNVVVRGLTYEKVAPNYRRCVKQTEQQIGRPLTMKLPDIHPSQYPIPPTRSGDWRLPAIFSHEARHANGVLTKCVRVHFVSL